MTDAADLIRKTAGDAPVSLGLILGSGLGALGEELENAHAFPFEDLPGFPVSGVSGHAGRLVVGELEGVRVALLSGRAHYYEKGDAAVMRPALETLKALGAPALLLTNAAGSLDEQMPPGSLMALTDHINYSGLNPLIGEETDARFTNMVDAYSPDLRARLLDAAHGLGQPLAEGVYMWFSGPSFETPAEIRAARILGADAVGMSTVPECILARFLGLEVAAVSVITNLGAGMTGAPLSHDETKSEAAAAQQKFRALVRRFVGSFK
ncbi:purine-nucleoside phosphorylase [Rhodovulum sp. DZ06]|uniref:purine-nucleoside phosphorylase n=1 Tax=Rhodovulum sp. DZ06 TaxID=3425126 RepID=UPI003D34B0F0